MASIYARWIKAGKMALVDVPKLWQERVEKLLEV